MEARGWNSGDIAIRMGGDRTPDEVAVDMLAFELGLAVQEDGLLWGDLFAKLAKAFDVSEALLRGLDRVWRDNPDRRVAFTPDDGLFGPVTTGDSHEHR